MNAGVPSAAPPRLRDQARQAWRRLRGGELSPGRAAASVAVGLLIGCTPLFGLHLVLVLLVCVPLGLDAVVAYLAANISNPFVAPFLITLEIEVGSLVLSGHHAPFGIAQARSVGVGGFVAQAALGSIIVGGAFAAVGAAVAWQVASWRVARRHRSLAAAIDRTIARYRGAPRGDRYYVASKLRSDPVVAAVAGLDVPFGAVLDLGSGRGQLALCLAELGSCARVRGIDWDARKVAIAARAAGGSASFEQGDVESADLPPSDTILLVDVLHYFPPVRQDAVLARAAAALRPGGRLVVRETDANARGPGKLLRAVERLLVRTGYNRGEKVYFRPAREIEATLEALGLEVRRLEAQLSANALIVATRPS